MAHLAKLTLVALGAGAFTLAGCGGKTQGQKEVDEQAEALQAQYEADAQATEAFAQGGPNEAAAEQKADQLREQGDRVEDHLKAAADELDDVPAPKKT